MSCLMPVCSCSCGLVHWRENLWGSFYWYTVISSSPELFHPPVTSEMNFLSPICFDFPAPPCLHSTGGDRTSWAPLGLSSPGFTIHLHLSEHTKHTSTLSSKALAMLAWESSLSLSTRGEETPSSLCAAVSDTCCISILCSEFRLSHLRSDSEERLTVFFRGHLSNTDEDHILFLYCSLLQAWFF